MLASRLRNGFNAAASLSRTSCGRRYVDVSKGFPSGSETRRRGVAHAVRTADWRWHQSPGKALPLPEMTISGLTRDRVFGEDQLAKARHSPAPAGM